MPPVLRLPNVCFAAVAVASSACASPPTRPIIADPERPTDRSECRTGIWPDLDLDHICPTLSPTARVDPASGRSLPPTDARTLPIDIAVSESGSFLGPRPHARWPDSLRVVVWNTQYTANLDAQIETLTQHPALRDADVYLLSEVDRCTTRNGMRRAARILAEAIGGTYIYGIEFVELSIGRTIGGDTGQAIVSRRPLGEGRLTCHSANFDWFSSADEPRLGARVTLHADIPVGPTTARVFAVHLESNDDEHGTRRAQQGRELVGRAMAFGSHGPQVIAGDFNAPVRDEGALTALRNGGYHDAMESLGDLGPTHDSGRRIDYAWTRGFRVKAGGILRDITTADHAPMWIELERIERQSR